MAPLLFKRIEETVDFKKLMESLAAMAAGEHPEDMFDQINGAYDSEMDSASARIGEGETRTQELEAEISRLKSHNYDLLMETRAATTGDEGDGDEGDGDEGDGDEGDEEPDIEDLFEDKE